MKLKPNKFEKATGEFRDQTGFVRHRDIKMKESELKKEEKLQETMIIGVCRKCREKLQWRFKFDKYKSLKAVGNCQGCKQKCVTKAYRTLCDSCATSRKACAGCTVILLPSDDVDYVEPIKEVKPAVEVLETPGLVGKASTVFVLKSASGLAENSVVNASQVHNAVAGTNAPSGEVEDAEEEGGEDDEEGSGEDGSEEGDDEDMEQEEDEA